MEVGLLNQVPYLSPGEAVRLLKDRRANTDLCAAVTAYCGNDIPVYLCSAPAFVLPRHIATPNRETEYVVEQAKQAGMRPVLTQDLDDEFSLANNLKRRLAAPEISFGDASRRPTYRKFQLLAGPAPEGAVLRTITARNGQTLAAIHNDLFAHEEFSNVVIADDAAWIDAHDRDNIARHFRFYLSLFLCFGVLFDDYEAAADRGFRDRIILPAISELFDIFDVTPLIVKSIDPARGMSERWWLSHGEKYLEQIAAVGQEVAR